MKKLTQYAAPLCLSVAAMVLAGCGSGTLVLGSARAYTLTSDTTSGISEIIGFTLGTSSVTPTVTLPAPSSDDFFAGLALDSSNNLYTIDVNNADDAICTVREYAAGAATGAAPIHQFTADINPDVCNDASGILVDSAHSFVYITSYSGDGGGNGSTMRFPLSDLTTGGTLAPVATATAGSDWGPAVLDSAGNIYVANYNGDEEEGGDDVSKLPFGFADGYSPTSPLLTSATYEEITGMYLSGNNLYVTGITIGSDDDDAPPQMDVYSITSTGAATSTKTIAGSNTLLQIPAAMYVDGAGAIYIEDRVQLTPDPNDTYGIVVRQFSSSASGNVAPAATATSTFTPIDEDLDSITNAIAVTQ